MAIMISLAGNWAKNRLKASDAELLRMYYNDFDDNGKNEQVLTSYVQGQKNSCLQVKMSCSKDAIYKGKNILPTISQKSINKRYFPKDKLSNAAVFKANYLAKCYFH